MVSEALQQSFMTTTLSSTSTLPWIWVIEALAGSNEIDTSLLIDLVKRAPDISDELGRNAREMVSLRVLESLFLRKISSANNSVCGDKIELDPSERCEDVLRHILFEVSESDLKTAGPELLKWDVLSFIKKKRSLLPKPYLQQLKNAIVDSTIPLSASLKERSGLCLQENQRETSLVPTKRSIDASIASVVEVYGTEAVSENNSDPRAEAAKKFKQDVVNPIQNIVPDLILPQRDQRDEVPVESCLGSQPITSNVDSEDEANGCMKDGGGEHATSRSVLRGSDYNHNELLPQRTTADGQFQNMRSDSNGCAEPGTSNGSSQQVIRQDSRTNGADYDRECNFPRDLNNGEPSKRAEEIIEQRHEPEYSSDTDEYHSESTGLAAQKNDFLNSQCTQGEDFTELNLCVKCNKGGNLLVCSSDTCPLMLHESCLGSVPEFDHIGNFYCPFCSYSRVILEYLEEKKKVSLARKDLAAFMGVGSGQRSKKSLPRSQGIEHNHSDDKNEPLCQNETGRDLPNHHSYHRLKENQSREGEESCDNENRNKKTKEAECGPADGSSVDAKVMNPPKPLVPRELVREESSFIEDSDEENDEIGSRYHVQFRNPKKNTFL